MARTSQSLVISAMLLFGPFVHAASEIQLDNGGTVTVSNAQYSRSLPHAFYDQALASLSHLFPAHVLLAGRRSDVLGEVAYSLVCYRETPSSDRVIVQGVAVHSDRAWNIKAYTPVSSYEITLGQVLEQIEKLPTNAGVQQIPANGRR